MSSGCLQMLDWKRGLPLSNVQGTHWEAHYARWLHTISRRPLGLAAVGATHLVLLTLGTMPLQGTRLLSEHLQTLCSVMSLLCRPGSYAWHQRNSCCLPGSSMSSVTHTALIRQGMICMACSFSPTSSRKRTAESAVSDAGNMLQWYQVCTSP